MVLDEDLIRIISTAVKVPEWVQREAIRKGMLLGLETWQDVALRAVEQWLKDHGATPPVPAGMRAVYVPADLPDKYARILERAAQQIVNDLAEDLDTVSVAPESPKIAGMK